MILDRYFIIHITIGTNVKVNVLHVNSTTCLKYFNSRIAKVEAIQFGIKVRSLYTSFQTNLIN